jgi:two-component system, chemotaxis family, response regulator Rcp1
MKNVKQAEILLVEDDAGSARLTELALQDVKRPVHLTVACDGVEALAMLRREGKYAGAVRPDLILLDLRLPKMNGREVLAEIKKDPELGKIPVVVLSFSVYQEDMQQCYDLQASGFISKPIETEQINSLLESLGGLKESLSHFAARRETTMASESTEVSFGAW